MRKTSLRPSFVKTVAAAGVAVVTGVATVRADPPPRAAACPATAPTANAPCTTVGLACGYLACMDHWTINAVCDGTARQWRISEASCNPPEPPIAPPVRIANPPGIVAPAVGPPLRPGRRRCSFVEDGHRYDRQCAVTRQPDGSLRVVAPGTRLNPTNGFTLTVTGSPGSYQAQGKLTAFGACSGAVSGPATLDGAGRSRAWRVRFRQCEIAVAP
ncbi:MAG: hypothetical protein HY909_23265 [Deltaproteobacteria bacterium]|nr:hypothetical protein [Deltaproteobacteria bacterium]